MVRPNFCKSLFPRGRRSRAACQRLGQAMVVRSFQSSGTIQGDRTAWAESPKWSLAGNFPHSLRVMQVEGRNTGCGLIAGLLPGTRLVPGLSPVGGEGQREDRGV